MDGHQFAIPVVLGFLDYFVSSNVETMGWTEFNFDNLFCPCIEFWSCAVDFSVVSAFSLFVALFI